MPSRADERRADEEIRTSDLLAGTAAGFGGAALPLGSGEIGGGVEGPIGHQADGDALAGLGAHVYLAVDDLFPAPQHLGGGDDVLADGGGKIVDAEVERRRLESRTVVDAGPRRQHAGDVDQRGGDAAVQRAPRVGVLVAIGQMQPRAIRFDRVDPHAEGRAVGNRFPARGKAR